jgi:hypothetical protein
MSSALMAVVATLVVIVFLEVGRRSGRPGFAKVSGWLSFVCGVLGVVAVATPMVQSALAPDGVDSVGKNAPWIFQASMILGLAGLIAGVYALVRRDRTWRTWVGLVAGGLVTGFWLLFLLGELLSPH